MNYHKNENLSALPNAGEEQVEAQAKDLNSYEQLKNTFDEIARALKENKRQIESLMKEQDIVKKRIVTLEKEPNMFDLRLIKTNKKLLIKITDQIKILNKQNVVLKAKIKALQVSFQAAKPVYEEIQRIRKVLSDQFYEDLDQLEQGDLSGVEYLKLLKDQLEKSEQSFTAETMYGILKNPKTELLKVVQFDLDDLNQNLVKECSEDYLRLLEAIEVTINLDVAELKQSDLELESTLQRSLLVFESVNVYLKKSWAISASVFSGELFTDIKKLNKEIIELLHRDDLSVQKRLDGLKGLFRTPKNYDNYNLFFKDHYPGKVKFSDLINLIKGEKVEDITSTAVDTSSKSRQITKVQKSSRLQEKLKNSKSVNELFELFQKTRSYAGRRQVLAHVISEKLLHVTFSVKFRGRRINVTFLKLVLNQYKKPNVKLIDLEVAKLLMGDPKFAFDKIPTGSSKTDKIMRRIMTEILDQFDPLNDVSRMFDMDPLSDEFKTTQLLLKKLKIDLNRDNSNLTPEYLRALMQCIPAKHRIIVDHIQMLLNSSVQIQTVDSETLSVDTVKLMNYDGLDKMLLAPQYHLGLDPKQVDQFHSLFFEALNMNSSALVKLGQKGFSMQDLFPMQDLILSKTGNYYYDTRSPKRPVANSKTFGREVYSVRIRKSKVDALWEKYQEIEKSVDTQIQFLKKQTSASYKGDQNELSLAMDLMRKSLVKKAFLSFSMVYLMENTRQDSNFKRFAKSFHAAKLNVEKSHVQSLLTAYADVYQGLDAQNMDMLTDLVLSELPFLLVGAGLTTIGAKLLVGGIKLAAKGLSAANKLSKVNRATTTVASSRAVLGTKAFIETVSKSKTGAHLLGVNNFVGASLMDSGKLLLTLGMADTVKQSLRRARETGKFSFNDFELIVQEVLDNMLENSSESDIFAMSLLLPMAIRFSSVIVKPLLSRKLLSKFEVKLLQMQNVAVAKFAWNTRQLLAATSQETVVLASGAVISQAAFNGAAELLNTYFEAGYSKRDVYSLLLNVTKRYKYCNFATEVDLKNLSTLVAVLKMVSAK